MFLLTIYFIICPLRNSNNIYINIYKCIYIYIYIYIIIYIYISVAASHQSFFVEHWYMYHTKSNEIYEYKVLLRVTVVVNTLLSLFLANL